VSEPIAFGSVDAESVDPFEFKNQFFGGAIENFYARMEEVQGVCPARRGSISGLFGLAGVDTLLADEDHQVSVLSFAQADQVLKDPSTYSSVPLYDRTLRSAIGETILGMDPPGHRRFRELIQPAFTRKEMDRWEREFVEDIVNSYLTPLIPFGRADLATDFAFLYPIHVTAIAAGLPVDDFDVFYRDTALLTNVAITETQRLAAGERLGSLVLRLIAERRADPRQDLISALIRAEFKEAPDPAHQKLSDEEIVAFLRLLVPAGAQTTYRALSNLLFGLLSHENQLDAVRADRSLIPQAVEEGLRWGCHSRWCSAPPPARPRSPDARSAPTTSSTCPWESPTMTPPVGTTRTNSTSSGPHSSTTDSAVAPTRAWASTWPGWNFGWRSTRCSTACRIYGSTPANRCRRRTA
jgi:cytochrome P450